MVSRVSVSPTLGSPKRRSFTKRNFYMAFKHKPSEGPKLMPQKDFLTLWPVEPLESSPMSRRCWVLLRQEGVRKILLGGADESRVTRPQNKRGHV